MILRNQVLGVEPSNMNGLVIYPKKIKAKADDIVRKESVRTKMTISEMETIDANEFASVRLVHRRIFSVRARLP